MEKNDKYFYLEKIFPNSNEILTSTYKSIDEIKDSCIYVLDTNVLLLPYKTSTQSLHEFKNIYNQLIKKNKLIIPARAIREFANNRGKNLAEIYKRLKQKESSFDRVESKVDLYPILEKEKSYEELLQLGKTIQNAVKESREKLKILQDKVSNYTWNDPVSELYRELFTDPIIKEVKKSQEELVTDLNFRTEHSIAPGYKDSSKSDKGIGDLIIWHTILEIGKELDTDVIFVTDDSKNDWFYIEEKKTIYPKFELFDEFRRFCKKSIHIVDVTTFLKIQNASEKTLTEIKENKTEIFVNKIHWLQVHYKELRPTQYAMFKLRDSRDNSSDGEGEIIDIKIINNDVTIGIEQKSELIYHVAKHFDWYLRIEV